MKEVLFAMILTFTCIEVIVWSFIGVYKIVKIVRKKVGVEHD